ncbi:nucleolar protein 14-like [Argiope bruennichi]|uniref:Nucleolar protein 14 like protein n=1 Tax=Argiope bruennichi TaxID=94029 RepID=A0A8T0E4D6_ARGBR|nr:nucleolar protein 14-like [Argiope bruennichi]KAF8764751.1 Nucleolar protein 14 like protein [Argiope bruennichi]
MVKKVFKKKISFKGEENPFNLKLNREKHTVLGQNTKGTKGLRCISRANIHLKRKELYNKNKRASQKANNFVDRRLLHENEEDSVTARFVQERKKKLKKNKYNLNDEELTHGGVPLHTLKSLKDEPIGSDDDEQLDAAFVNKAHFGGANQEPLSHKEIIDKLILESKQKKLEKKVENELTLDLTEKLDQDWKASIKATSRVPEALEPLQVAKKKESVLELLQTTDKSKMPLSVKLKNDPPKEDPYNILEIDLKYSKKSTPITRGKTAEELEKEEQEEKLKLEQERCQRMNDDREEKINAKNHLSADSIIDDFDLEPLTIEDNVNEKSSSEKDSDYSDSEDDVDNDEFGQLSEHDNDEVVNDAESEISENDLMNGNSNESFGIPTNIDEFEQYLENHNHISAEGILAAVGHIINPSLKAKSEKKLNKLTKFFGTLIEYSIKCLKYNPAVSENLVPYLFDIAKIAPIKTAEKILCLLDEEQDLFQKRKVKKNNFIRLQSLLLLKYCSTLYSVSDFTHPIVTPAILFMCDILSSEFFITFPNIESRLYICSIILDCVTQSKRLVPEALSFLNKILKLACPFKTEFIAKNQMINLVITEKQTSNLITDINMFLPDETEVTEDLRKLRIILKSVKLLTKFSALYVHLPSFNNLFSETLSFCSELPTEYYPPSLADAVFMLLHEIKKQDSRKLLPLTYENTKPKPLKLFEPAYESKFTKKDDIKKKLKLLKNVSQKIKKEEKDMLREMRRDLQVVAAEKLKEQLESDAERKRKVKELYHDLAVQESEYKKLMKSKP